MKYLLDTQTLLWLVGNDPQLSKKVKKIYLDDKNTILLSTISLWEMAIKINLKKLILPTELNQFIKNHVIENGIKVVNFESKHIYQLEKLLLHHRDPFDRGLIAYCLEEKIPIITKDSAFKKYKIKTIW